ncbi:hypothetical protein ACHAQA_001747 [Verticillium albo-atrum]
MLAPIARFAPRLRSVAGFARAVSTLQTNPHIKVFPADASRASFLLSLLDSQPPNPRLAIGFSTKDPPTPQSFTENQSFLNILYEVLAEHAPQDEELVAQARAFAGPGGGGGLGAGGIFGVQQQSRRGNKKPSESTGAGGASGQGGAGGGGRGGYIHLSDSRNPPDFGRIAWPEDIIGSLEVDPEGTIIGKLQSSGTYRMLTNEGALGLSPYLRGKLLERLRAEDKQERGV